MQQTVVWKPWHNPGVENLRLSRDEHGIHASSHLMQNLQGNSIAATYVLNCDPLWRFRRLWLKVDNHGQRSLDMRRDIRGNWFHNGEPRPDLQHCHHVMLSASPFTHTPALQRCALEIGQSEQVQVAYIDLLTLKVEARAQRYVHLRRLGRETLYRSETEGTEGNELTVDEHALLMSASDQYVRMSTHHLKINTWV